MAKASHNRAKSQTALAGIFGGSTYMKPKTHPRDNTIKLRTHHVNDYICVPNITMPVTSYSRETILFEQRLYIFLYRISLFSVGLRLNSFSIFCRKLLISSSDMPNSCSKYAFIAYFRLIPFHPSNKYTAYSYQSLLTQSCHPTYGNVET